MNTNTRLATTTALLAALVAFPGCHFPFSRAEPVQHETLSSHTSPHAAALRRVAVLPFSLADSVGRSARVMDASMTAALRELGLHEVITVSVVQCEKLLPRDVIQSNHIGTDELLALRDALHCDGVIVGRIEQFDGFDPLSMGVTAALVSCLDGTVTWSATAHFDSRRKDVQDDIQAWYERTAGTNNESIAGWKLTLKSPQMFTRYCAEKLALSIPLPVAKR